ncbi:hypothetical protein IID19_01795 [Patescibacteria group bacterium]|nr:hypothetical protein [Patescibacteria group bacterium]
MTNKKRFVFALATFVGTVMGVGLFGLPYVGVQSGYLILVMYLFIGAGIVIVINFLYSEVAVNTKGLHRLPGYAAIYLGAGGKRAAFIVKSLALFGALLAYLIIGGQFLASLFGGPVILYTFIFLILGSFLIWQDSKSVGAVEFALLFVFLAIVIFLFAAGVSKIDLNNLVTVKINNFFVPYGIVLFSLWGASIVPEIKEQLKNNLKQVKQVVFWGVLICLAVYLLFSTLIIGISGTATSRDGISSLSDHFGELILFIGYVFGIITTFTSFIALGLTVKKLFWYDYHLPKIVAWSLASFIPLGLFVIGLQDFIGVIGITGAVMLGLDGVLVTLVYLSMKRRQKPANYIKLKILGSSLIFLLSVGVVLQIFYTINGY